MDSGIKSGVVKADENTSKNRTYLTEAKQASMMIPEGFKRNFKSFNRHVVSLFAGDLKITNDIVSKVVEFYGDDQVEGVQAYRRQSFKIMEVVFKSAAIMHEKRKLNAPIIQGVKLQILPDNWIGNDSITISARVGVDFFMNCENTMDAAKQLFPTIADHVVAARKAIWDQNGQGTANGMLELDIKDSSKVFECIPEVIKIQKGPIDINIPVNVPGRQKLICFACKKEGHIQKYCAERQQNHKNNIKDQKQEKNQKNQKKEKKEEKNQKKEEKNINQEEIVNEKSSFKSSGKFSNLHEITLTGSSELPTFTYADAIFAKDASYMFERPKRKRIRKSKTSEPEVSCEKLVDEVDGQTVPELLKQTKIDPIPKSKESEIAVQNVVKQEQVEFSIEEQVTENWDESGTHQEQDEVPITELDSNNWDEKYKEKNSECCITDMDLDSDVENSNQKNIQARK